METIYIEVYSIYTLSIVYIGDNNIYIETIYIGENNIYI